MNFLQHLESRNIDGNKLEAALSDFAATIILPDSYEDPAAFVEAMSVREVFEDFIQFLSYECRKGKLPESECGSGKRIEIAANGASG